MTHVKNKDTLSITDLHLMDENDKTLINDYNLLLDSKFQNFQKNNKRCLALTNSNSQCKYYKSLIYKNNVWVEKHILCKLHCKKKYKPDYVVVFIHNHDNHGNHDNDPASEKHIIAYPYKNKEQYNKDIEIYKQELKDIYSESLKKIKQIITCKVCNETFTHNELIKCSNTTCDNKHLVCSSCLYGYINSQISNNIGTYDCMFNKAEKCNGTYTITSINKLFDVDHVGNTLSIWQELVNITDIYKMANICDNYKICPLCRKWGCIFEPDPQIENADADNDNDNNSNIECMNCKLQWCTLCNRATHIGNSCYKLNFTDKETPEQYIHIIDNRIQDIISKVLTHKCSTCSCAYTKEEGCNLMTCAQCGGMTCYLCNAKIYYKAGRGKYWHFIGHELSDSDAKCHLWNRTSDDSDVSDVRDVRDVREDKDCRNGNKDYNNKKIISEIMLFLSKNNDKTKKIIYDRIMFLYEKDNEFTFIIEKFRSVYM